MIEKNYTIKEVAAILRMSPKTVANLISARRLTAYRGRPVLIPESALKAYLDKRRSRAVA